MHNPAFNHLDMQYLRRSREQMLNALGNPSLPQKTKINSIEQIWSGIIKRFNSGYTHEELPFPIRINSWTTRGGIINQVKNNLNGTETHGTAMIAIPNPDKSDSGYIDFVWMILPVLSRHDFVQ